MKRLGLYLKTIHAIYLIECILESYLKISRHRSEDYIRSFEYMESLLRSLPKIIRHNGTDLKIIYKGS